MTKMWIAVNRDPIMVAVDEDATEEQITAQVEQIEGFAGWDYQDDWRK